MTIFIHKFDCWCGWTRLYHNLCLVSSVWKLLYYYQSDKTGLVSANASYERTTQDILVLTGLNVSRGTQQRLVHRQTFELPMLEDTVEEMSIDGGKVRIRTPQGEICRWQDYKAVNLHQHCREAFLQDNEKLVGWVNRQPLATPLTCLGDGHDGIWNLFEDIAS